MSRHMNQAIVLAAPSDVPAWRHGLADAQAVADFLGGLRLQNGVGPCGQGSAGHDSHGLPRTDRAGERPARQRDANYRVFQRIVRP